MSANSIVIVALCSRLCMGEGIMPLEPKEWSALASLLLENKMTPADLMKCSPSDMTAKLGIDSAFSHRLVRLLDRSAALAIVLARYEHTGICVVTRADPRYPKRLKTSLGGSCPPLFYCAGDTGLADAPAVGYVGSRSVDASDVAFAKLTVEKTLYRGCALVSGGAKGVDSTAEAEALYRGGCVVEYLSDGMFRRLKTGSVVRAVQDGRLLLISVSSPDAGFNTGIAMMRNKYIYAHSVATVVVKSDFGRGGTWSGATECLKKALCPVLCRDKPEYPGNAELIRRGAIPVDEHWDGDISRAVAEFEKRRSEQLSFTGED